MVFLKDRWSCHSKYSSVVCLRVSHPLSRGMWVHVWVEIKYWIAQRVIGMFTEMGVFLWSSSGLVLKYNSGFSYFRTALSPITSFWEIKVKLYCIDRCFKINEWRKIHPRASWFVRVWTVFIILGQEVNLLSQKKRKEIFSGFCWKPVKLNVKDWFLS